MIQLNLLLLAYLIVSLFRSGFQAILHWLNLSYLKRHGISVPEAFQETITQEHLRKVSDYTVASNRFSMVVHLADQAFLLAFLLSGFLPYLTRRIEQWNPGFILSGLIFYGILGGLENLFHTPFSLYDTFVIEQGFGFNTRTLRMWLLDWAKNIVIFAFLGGVLLAGLLALIHSRSEDWWIWSWLAVGLFEILMLWLFPAVIAPFFNKFEPIESKTLEERVQSLMEKAGLHLKGVFKMDASKRSRHTNAYFTGIGKSKRIVLYDTLLGVYGEEEILAILSHEIGHWKKRHVLKQVLLVEMVSLAAFFVAAKLMGWHLLYQTFGFQGPVAYSGLFLVGAILNPIGFFLQPVGSSISRRHETEADDYGIALMQAAEPMKRALQRLAIDNLANLSPHPLYAWYYYSHPPLVERITRLSP